MCRVLSLPWMVLLFRMWYYTLEDRWSPGTLKIGAAVRYLYTKLHGVIQHTVLISIFTAVRASSLKLRYTYLFYPRIWLVMWGDLRREVYKLFIHMVESFLLPESKGSLIRISKAYYIVGSTPESGLCGNGTICLRGREQSLWCEDWKTRALAYTNWQATKWMSDF